MSLKLSKLVTKATANLSELSNVNKEKLAKQVPELIENGPKKLETTLDALALNAKVAMIKKAIGSLMTTLAKESDVVTVEELEKML